MKIIPIAFTSRELSDFSSVLDLAVSRLSKPWSLVDSEAIADFHAVSIHGPEEFSLLAGSAPSLDRIIVYSDGRFPVQARWTLTKRESSPPRVSELIALLQQIEKHQQETALPDDVSSFVNERPGEDPMPDEERAADLLMAEDLSVSESPTRSASQSAPSWWKRLIRIFSSRREYDPE